MFFLKWGFFSQKQVSKFVNQKVFWKTDSESTSKAGKITGSSDTFHEEMKLGSFSVGLSLNTHLWLLSAATFPTSLQKITKQTWESYQTHLSLTLFSFSHNFLSNTRKKEREETKQVHPLVLKCRSHFWLDIMSKSEKKKKVLQRRYVPVWHNLDE